MKKLIKWIIFNLMFCAVSSLTWQSPLLAGTITGTIRYEGHFPKLPKINMSADPVCMAKHSTEVYPEVLVLGEGNTMANVFVRVVAGLPQKNYPTPKEPAVLDQEGCMYKPHVMGVMVGQPIKVLNPDGTLHNVHAVPKINKEFNLAMPAFRKEITVSFDKPEFIIPFKCDVHPWMSAYVAVMDHPFFDVTEKDGQYTISGLPPGTYAIEAWHEKLGTQKAEVTITADDETVTQDFVMKKPRPD